MAVFYFIRHGEPDFSRRGTGIYLPERKVLWESAEDMRKRVFSVLEKYKNYSHVIVCCHGTLMEYVLELGYHPKHAEMLEFVYPRKQS